MLIASTYARTFYMKIITETPRLRFRQFCEEDLENLYRLDSDPEVMKYLSNGVPGTLDQAKAALTRILARYHEGQNYGVWAAELKPTNEFIGWFSLKPLAGTSEIEVGYRLMKKFWGQGLATEGASKMLELGFNTVGLKKIVGIVNISNAASKRVLEKAGFTYDCDIDYKSPNEAVSRRVSWYEIFK